MKSSIFFLVLASVNLVTAVPVLYIENQTGEALAIAYELPHTNQVVRVAYPGAVVPILSPDSIVDLKIIPYNQDAVATGKKSITLEGASITKLLENQPQVILSVRFPRGASKYTIGVASYTQSTRQLTSVGFLLHFFSYLRPLLEQKACVRIEPRFLLQIPQVTVKTSIDTLEEARKAIFYLIESYKGLLSYAAYENLKTVADAAVRAIKAQISSARNQESLARAGAAMQKAGMQAMQSEQKLAEDMGVQFRVLATKLFCP